MKERLSGAWQSFKGFWGKTSKKMRIVYLSGLVIILGFSLAVVMVLNKTDYIVLRNDLTSEDMANYVNTLNEIGVQYVLEGSQLMIHKEDELYARMQLATRNMPSGFNYDVFTQGSTLTATQFERERWDLFQTQERLQGMIMTFPDVQEVTVIIGMPQRNNFVIQEDKQVPTAAVKLQTAMGRTLTPQQIQGIINIVRDAVPGLTEDNISLADQNGDMRLLLSGAQSASNTKLALAEEINETVRRRIMSILTPIYGDGNVMVAVNTMLDTDQRVIESETFLPYDPENPTNNPYGYAEIAAEMQNNEGFAVGVPGANDNVDVMQYPAWQEEVDGANFYSLHHVYDYLVSSVREQIIKEGFDIVDMTATVVVNTAQFSTGLRDQLIDTVATTAGISADRVSVQNYVFEPIEIRSERTIENQMNLLLLIGLALLMLFIIVAMIIAAARRKKARALAAEAEAMALISEESTLLDLLGQQQEEEFEPITIPDSPEMKLKTQIRDLAVSDPEIVANLIKTWLMQA